MGSHRRIIRSRIVPLAVVAVLGLIGAACAPPASTGSVSGDVVAAVNQDRAANGLGGLAVDGQLTAYAQSWANHLAATGGLEHTDLAALMRLPYMAQWWTMGENLLTGTGAMSGAAAEDLWMGSSGHRASILNPAFTHIGVAAVSDSSGRLWMVAEFGAR